MYSSDQADPLQKQTPGDFEAIDELVDEENQISINKTGALSNFFGKSEKQIQNSEGKDRIK